MSKSLKLLAIMAGVTVIAACAKAPEEVIMVDPEPISVEPTYTGKYK